jgi:hypothetical protein
METLGVATHIQQCIWDPWLSGRSLLAGPLVTSKRQRRVGLDVSTDMKSLILVLFFSLPSSLYCSAWRLVTIFHPLAVTGKKPSDAFYFAPHAQTSPRLLATVP